jgi:hypothetical protein
MKVKELLMAIIKSGVELDAQIYVTGYDPAEDERDLCISMDRVIESVSTSMIRFRLESATHFVDPEVDKDLVLTARDTLDSAYGEASNEIARIEHTLRDLKTSLDNIGDVKCQLDDIVD